MTKHITCPCNPNKSYSACCQHYHKGINVPETAEQLMRSRYSAYVLKLTDYINSTWHKSTRPNIATLDNNQPIQWIKLVINKAWNSQNTNEAFVDFDAFYEANGKLERMHEVSRFVFSEQKWFYIDGKIS
ncbi:YchJ family protein [Entomomonas asaccharolytica]|uniref:SEC-C motif-containing protein n=1 Tax=Entomomonas asaccharolytica TaxID=2785331 RepID=A0A974NCW0_9GAMM|nr:YchJ family metal-binding protein [Entomomonas asaccharolytica]QQP84313.1 SEC-C motif-containing protein [Entomomonas asaccharolytica]